MVLGARIKKFFWGIFAIAFLIMFVAWMVSSPRPEHIEDTNGADKYSLQTITERDVAEMKMGSRGSISEKETGLNLGGSSANNKIKYSSKKFTGVYSLRSSTVIKGSDIYVSLLNLKVKEGNFAFYIVFDGKVVGKIDPTTELFTFSLDNVEKTATLEYIIAGESANFSFIATEDFN